MAALRVASTSNTTALAGAIAWRVRQEGQVEVEAIGAGAVNQAVKAVAVARTYVALEGIDLRITPYFVTIDMAGERRSAIRLRVSTCQPEVAAAPPVEMAVEQKV